MSTRGHDMHVIAIERGDHTSELHNAMEEWKTGGGQISPHFAIIPPSDHLVTSRNFL
jgi:hypothetical protein